MAQMEQDILKKFKLGDYKDEEEDIDIAEEVAAEAAAKTEK